MAEWQLIHARHPIVCKGKGKGGKGGCCAWDAFGKRCYRAIFNDGRCGFTLEGAAKREKDILKGETK